MKSKSIAEA